MIKLFFLIILILPVGNLFSQQAFHKELETDSSWSVRKIYEKEDGYIFLTRYYKNSSSSEIGLILFLDKETNIVKTIKDTSFQFVQFNMIYERNNKYYILGSYKENAEPLYKNAFWIYSKNFEFEEFVPFPDTNLIYTDNRMGYPIFYENDFVVTNTGSNKQSPTSDTITTDGKLMKYDFEGNTLWEKYFSYEQIPYSEDFTGDLIEYKNGYVFQLTSQYINIPYIYHHIIYTDKEGNEIWRKRIDNYQPLNVTLPSIDSKIDLRKIIKLENGNLLTISQLEHDKYNLGKTDVLFMELDTLGNEISAKTIPFATNFMVQQFHKSNDNNYFMTGSWAVNDSFLRSQYLMKIDFEYDLKWIKTFEVEGSNIMHSRSITTDDKGFLLAGTRFRYIPIAGYNIILEKTDCEGNLEWDNSSCLIPNENEMVIFPNPTITELTIQCAGLEINTSTKLKIFDNIGQLVYEDISLINPIFTISTSQFSQGIYFCEIRQNEKILNGKFIVVK